MKTLKTIRAERAFLIAVERYKDIYKCLCDIMAGAESGQIHPKKAIREYHILYPIMCRYAQRAKNIETKYLGTDEFYSDVSHIYAFFTV